MKLSYLAPGLVAVSLVACESMNQPISSGSFDPLAPPGSNIVPTSGGFGPNISPGQFVSATVDNTAFYKVKPKGDADADKVLTRGTQMKVISTSGNYVRVELDSGEVGFVPTVMVEAPGAADADVTPLDGAYQVYPPVGGGGGAPLPLLDTTDMPPDGGIPPLLDVDATPSDGPAPLPPGIDDEPESPAEPTPPAEEMPKPAEETPKPAEENAADEDGVE